VPEVDVVVAAKQRDPLQAEKNHQKSFLKVLKLTMIATKHLENTQLLSKIELEKKLSYKSK
jgi:hypothetical protein